MKTVQKRTLRPGVGDPRTSGPKAWATALGVMAIVLWSALALLTRSSESVPPFELLFLTFAVAFASSVPVLAFRGRKTFSAWKQPKSAWIFSFSGIFVYHALYFYALSRAPAAKASLIAYLWPMLMVLFSAVMDRSTMLPRHFVGATSGFIGSAFVILDRTQSPVDEGHVDGYLAAAGCAIVWAAYSVLNRRFRNIPSDMIGGVCGLVAVAGLLVHLMAEPTVPPTASAWVSIVLLGLGPAGAAFFAWDYATKHGHVPILGALSYFAPLLSTLLLVVAGSTSASPGLVTAALLIVAGATVASFKRDRGRSLSPEPER
ncbi:aromatic amino acid exporter YddG [Lichenibacterium minor]|nr:EamA family transporter [Lichenibacterium minor]